MVFVAVAELYKRSWIQFSCCRKQRHLGMSVCGQSKADHKNRGTHRKKKKKQDSFLVCLFVVCYQTQQRRTVHNTTLKPAGRCAALFQLNVVSVSFIVTPTGERGIDVN